MRAKIVARPERRNRALRSINLFRLLLLQQSYEIGLALNVRITNPDLIILCVRSTACNHGPVLRGCMIMQSTTCQSFFRSDSLSQINSLRLYRPSYLDVSVLCLSQLTNCKAIVRSESLSPISRQRFYRPSYLDESVCVFRGKRSSRSQAERYASLRRAVNKCNDQARMAEPSVHAIVPLDLARQSYEFGLVLNVRITNPDLIILCVRSTACNHGPVLRGCMIMQSTTCQTLFRSDSLSPINRLRLYRPSYLDESVCACCN